MSIELEKAVLICMYKDEGREYSNPKDIDRSLFPSMAWWYDKIIPYIEANPKTNMVLATSVLGPEIMREIITFRGSVPLYDTYLSKLKQERYNERLQGNLDAMKVNQEILLEGLELYTPKTKDTNDYNLEGDLKAYVEELEARKNGTIERYSWGISYLDRMLGKLKMGKMFVIKGLHKFGKTTFAVKIFSSFIQRKIPVIFISTEMMYFEILDKLVSLNTEIDSFKLGEGDLTDSDMTKITQALSDKISYNPGHIIICVKLTMDYIRKKIDETKTKIIMVDFLQMLHIEGIPNGMTHTNIMSKMATSLKNLCLEKNVTIIALSQVNSDGNTKDCLAFEEKADTILHLKERDKGIETATTKEMDMSIMNRNGNSGIVKLVYCKKYGDFLEEESNIPEEKDYKNIYK